MTPAEQIKLLREALEKTIRSNGQEHRVLCEKYSKNDDPSAMYHAGAVSALVVLLNELNGIFAIAGNLPATEQPGEVPGRIPTEAMCNKARWFILARDAGITKWGALIPSIPSRPTIPYIEKKILSDLQGHITKWDVADCIYQLMAEGLPERQSATLTVEEEREAIEITGRAIARTDHLAGGHADEIDWEDYSPEAEAALTALLERFDLRRR